MRLRHLLHVRTISSNGVRSDKSVEAEVRQMHATAKRIASNKKSARRFLVSLGMYTATGKLKRQFR
jgi:hypothetical protein